MDDLEFSKRLLSDPLAEDAELEAACAESGARQKQRLEAREFERRLQTSLSDVTAPEHLRQKLLNIPDQADRNSTDRASTESNRLFQYFALAASLVLAVGIAFNIGSGGPTGAELAMGRDALEHVYHEENEIAAINTGSLQASFDLSAVNAVMANADSQWLNASTLQEMPVRYAEPCEIFPDYRSAHLIMEAPEGALNVIVINSSPVRQQFRINDQRFQGLVVPLKAGNLVLVGESDTDLEYYRDMLSGQVGWAI